MRLLRRKSVPVLIAIVLVLAAVAALEMLNRSRYVESRPHGWYLVVVRYFGRGSTLMETRYGGKYSSKGACGRSAAEAARELSLGRGGIACRELTDEEAGQMPAEPL